VLKLDLDKKKLDLKLDLGKKKNSATLSFVLTFISYNFFMLFQNIFGYKNGYVF
jgi:hypothetical protein